VDLHIFQLPGWWLEFSVYSKVPATVYLGLGFPATALKKRIYAVSILLVCFFVNVQGLGPQNALIRQFNAVAVRSATLECTNSEPAITENAC
jgi:hypothetical protein